MICTTYDGFPPNKMRKIVMRVRFEDKTVIIQLDED